jgi:hypothetical protein
MQKENMIFCYHCFSWVKGIFTQGHLQCERCTQVLEPCCGGKRAV